ncbi:hypothetical protein E8E13_003282 [Curvularia kusanoi]|uniref:Nucleoside phosphorylase domain-containing protein n=1 Tax=Curvularia kusanoi TaxID=90978 RepID=A0A9P4T7E7_CURKU|nr:hypothetical protein E8E13_003282 [Curvularia kusanoi]
MHRIRPLAAPRAILSASKPKPRPNLSFNYVPSRAYQRFPFGGANQQQYQRFSARSGVAQLFSRWAARPTFYRDVGVITAGGATVYVLNLEEVPVSGRRRFNFIPASVEQALGESTVAEIQQAYAGRFLDDSDPRSRMVKRVLESERMSQAPLILIPILASLAFDVSFYSANMILQLFLSMPASRKHEAEADYIGLLMAAKACYRPEAAMEFWHRMEKSGQEQPPQILSTHPSNHNREEKIREWLPEAHEKMQASECAGTGRYFEDFKDKMGGFENAIGNAATSDYNQYVLGTTVRHNVAIGCLPAGRIGTSSATFVAAQMIRTFPNIQFCLMVGIGGGVPGTNGKIRLGDVVVSQPTDTFGGVVQYDMGKTTVDGFVRTGALNSPPEVLLNAIVTVQANELLEESSLLKYAAKLEGTRFDRSRTGDDVLFDAAYDHEDPNDRTCDACNTDKVDNTRKSRQLGKEIEVHYGTIASGNRVMKNALERDKASRQLGGVLCFEMEAAGLMNTSKCLVIRGICDYSDSHKNDGWQLYAAGIAAAYAKEVLSVINPIEVADMQIALNGTKPHVELQTTRANLTPQGQQNGCDMVSLNNTGIADLAAIGGIADLDSSPGTPQSSRHHPIEVANLSAIRNALSEEHRKKIENSLHFRQRDARFLTIKLAQTRTCQWLYENSRYTNWLHANKIDHHQPFFWIKGKPGSGKSILMKHLFLNTKKAMSDSIVISFFFNARGEELEKTTSGLYRALLLQLLQKAPQTWTVFSDDEYLDAKLDLVKQSGWPDEVLRQIFVACLQELENERVICYVDALDECPEAAIREMISFFESIREMDSTGDFRVCFSSRHYPEISIRTGVQLALEAEAEHVKDIALYIDANLNLSNDPQFEAIKAELLSKASGIFLWVHLVIPVLNKAYDSGRIKALQSELARTPIGLHELFADMVTRDQHSLGPFQLCIYIILFAAGPLEPRTEQIGSP